MKQRILCVDDDHNFLDSLNRTLYDLCAAWDIYLAHNVDEATEMTKTIAFDAIITDISMPGKVGCVLLQSLRQTGHTCDIPVIVLTGMGANSLKREAFKLGASDLLNKPINPHDLYARLKNVLQLKHYQDKLKQQDITLETMVQERTYELEASRLDIILRLGKAAEYREEETGRMGCYCRAIAEELNVAPDFVDAIFLTSPLHDIGKIGIPDRILLKPGKLTPAERKTMESHCVIGANILLQKPAGLTPFLKWRKYRPSRNLQDPILAMAAATALGHHEKWDGTGYPKGLFGQDIPIASRITALADVYDALRSSRRYKEAFSEEKTLAIMSEEAGRHFDPLMCSAFEKLTDTFHSIHKDFSDMENKSILSLELA